MKDLGFRQFRVQGLGSGDENHYYKGPHASLLGGSRGHRVLSLNPNPETLPYIKPLHQNLCPRGRALFDCDPAAGRLGIRGLGLRV